VDKGGVGVLKCWGVEGKCAEKGKVDIVYSHTLHDNHKKTETKQKKSESLFPGLVSVFNPNTSTLQHLNTR
jgi:hypothetical protein